MIDVVTDAQKLIAAGDPLAYQQITAANAPVETGEQPTTEMQQALEEARRTGFAYDPFSLEDDMYGPAEIEGFLNGAELGRNGDNPFVQ